MSHHVTVTNWICWMNGPANRGWWVATNGKFEQLDMLWEFPRKLGWQSSSEVLPNYLHRCINIECLWYYIYSIRVLPGTAAYLFCFPTNFLPLNQFYVTNDTSLSSSLPTFNLQIPSLLGHLLLPLACQHSLSKSTECCIKKVASESFHVLIFCRLLPRPTVNTPRKPRNELNIFRPFQRKQELLNKQHISTFDGAARGQDRTPSTTLHRFAE